MTKVEAFRQMVWMATMTKVITHNRSWEMVAFVFGTSLTITADDLERARYVDGELDETIGLADIANEYVDYQIRDYRDGKPVMERPQWLPSVIVSGSDPAAPEVPDAD